MRLVQESQCKGGNSAGFDWQKQQGVTLANSATHCPTLCVLQNLSGDSFSSVILVNIGFLSADKNSPRSGALSSVLSAFRGEPRVVADKTPS